MEFLSPWQFYTFHSIVKGEAQPVVYALMQSCNIRAYENLLKVVKDRMKKFGNVGTLSMTATWIFDFECAVLQVVRNDFGVTQGTPHVITFYSDSCNAVVI